MKNNSVDNLISLGCGIEIINSQIERGAIHAAVSNAKTFLKYGKDGVKSGLFNKEESLHYVLPYYKKLLEVQHLADKYNYLWGEKFYKIKLQITKFYDNNI
jgi:hypothetical protein